MNAVDTDCDAHADLSIHEDYAQYLLILLATVGASAGLAKDRFGFRETVTVIDLVSAASSFCRLLSPAKPVESVVGVWGNTFYWLERFNGEPLGSTAN